MPRAYLWCFGWLRHFLSDILNNQKVDYEYVVISVVFRTAVPDEAHGAVDAGNEPRAVARYANANCAVVAG